MAKTTAQPKNMTQIAPGLQEDTVLTALRGFHANSELSYRPQVHRFLRDAIVRGVLPPHTSLSEAAIADALDVSRTPVREALAQLAEERLVNIYRKVGTIVAPISVSQLEEGRFARSTLECANHVQLAQTITPAQLGEFGRIVEEQREAVAAGDVERFFELDELMHQQLFEFSGRAHVWEMLQPMKRQFDRVRWLLLERVADHAEHALCEHELILAQMASRNVAQLGATVASHIDRVGSHLPEVQGRVPDYFVE